MKKKTPSGPSQISFAAHQAHIDKFHNCTCGSYCATSIDLTVQDPHRSSMRKGKQIPIWKLIGSTISRGFEHMTTELLYTWARDKQTGFWRRLAAGPVTLDWEYLSDRFLLFGRETLTFAACNSSFSVGLRVEYNFMLELLDSIRKYSKKSHVYFEKY